MNDPYTESSEYDSLSHQRSINLNQGYNELVLTMFPIPYGITSTK